jgi:hypothetical protein
MEKPPFYLDDLESQEKHTEQQLELFKAKVSEATGMLSLIRHLKSEYKWEPRPEIIEATN